MEDAYIIRAGGRDGFMDEAGNVIQAPVFDDMGPFHAGYGASRCRPSCPRPDERGKVVSPSPWDRGPLARSLGS